MTVVVTFLCDDGVVVAADSMLTPSFGGISVGHHDCRKVHLLENKQVFAYAGDLASQRGSGRSPPRLSPPPASRTRSTIRCASPGEPSRTSTPPVSRGIRSR